MSYSRNIQEPLYRRTLNILNKDIKSPVGEKILDTVAISCIAIYAISALFVSLTESGLLEKIVTRNSALTKEEISIRYQQRFGSLDNNSEFNAHQHPRRQLR